MEREILVVWSWKETSHARQLPPDANHSVFDGSLKLVEISISCGAHKSRKETVAIAAGASSPGLSVEDGPVLCRLDGCVHRSAVKKVRVSDIYDAASWVQPSTLQELLSVSGCKSFLET